MGRSGHKVTKSYEEDSWSSDGDLNRNTECDCFSPAHWSVSRSSVSHLHCLSGSCAHRRFRFSQCFISKHSYNWLASFFDVVRQWVFRGLLLFRRTSCSNVCSHAFYFLLTCLFVTDNSLASLWYDFHWKIRVEFWKTTRQYGRSHFLLFKGLCAVCAWYLCVPCRVIWDLLWL